MISDLKCIDDFLEAETETVSPMIAEFMNVPLEMFDKEQLIRIVRYLGKDNNKFKLRNFGEF